VDTNWSKLIFVSSSNCAETHGSIMILLCYMLQQSKTHHIAQWKDKKVQSHVAIREIFEI
jgi:hypothetical protein